MIYLLIPYGVALALVALELRGALRPCAFPVPALHPRVWIAIVLASYALQIALLRYAALHEDAMPAWRAAMPIPVVYLNIQHADAIAFANLVLGGIQSFALVALYRLHPHRGDVIAGAAALVAMSVAAPVLSSFDVYGYMHDAILGYAGYARVTTPLPGEYAFIDRWFRTPHPVIYGPLWIPIVRLMTAAGATLFWKIVAYRACSAGVYVAMLALLRAYGVPRRILCVAALNPALALQYVANAHNDVIAIAIVLAAAVMARRSAATSFALVAVAGALKLPYAVLALPVVANVRPAALRYGGCAAALGATLAITWLGGGPAYARVVAGYAHSLPDDLAHAVPFAAALFAVGAALAGARRLRTAVWLMPVFGSFRLPWIFPWYAIFGLPYALARHSILRYVLVSFPFVTALLMPELMRNWTLLVVFPLVLLASVFPSRRTLPPIRA